MKIKINELKSEFKCEKGGMNGKERLTERYKDTHPGIGSYLECMSRAYATGLSGFCLGV